MSTDAVLHSALEQDESRDRMKHVFGRFERSASEFYHDFQVNDEQFYNLPLRAMSKVTCNILRAIDYKDVRKKRNENYAFLDSILGDRNKLTLIPPDGPYCYPYYCENGMAIKKKLAACKIYVPTLWPNVLDMEGTLENDYAQNILPLPCDQRYNLENMKMIGEYLR